VTLQNCNRFFGNYKGFAELDCTITEYEARGRAYSEGGGNVTVLAFVLAFYVTWSRALARAGIGGVERQNPSICMNRSFVNNLFFP
jgi:hypothetical protein